jgi:dTDP-4-dehydrorhamnose 3,5-epimerase
MKLQIEEQCIRDVWVVTPERYADERGFFTEVFRKDQLAALGIGEIVQFNQSGSVKDVLRGLHFQWQPAMGKLMRVARGAAFLVALDIRKGSPTLGRWIGIEASADNRKQLWAPAGFARGFCVLSDYAEIQYLCTGIYNPEGESAVLWNDPEIGIEWPVASPILSGKDRGAQTLAQWLQCKESDFFRY